MIASNRIKTYVGFPFISDVITINCQINKEINDYAEVNSSHN